jgi:4-amino-4-deoxy-L-arabinose transferase-like glycosyltransferase
MRSGRKSFGWALAALCLVWAATQLALAWNDAPIVDEPIHFFDGSLAVDRGDPTANPEHPPLVKVLASLAARPWRSAAAGVAPGADPRATAPSLFLEPHPTARKRIFAARLPSIAISLAAIVACGLWGASLGGGAGGWTAAALLASSSLLGAHAHFVTTDAPVAALVFCGAFFLEPLRESPRVGRIAGAGLLLGAALAAKYSAVFLVPVVLAVSFFRRPTRRTLAAHLAVAVVAVATLAAISGWASRRATASEIRAEIATARTGATTNRLDPGGMAAFLWLGDRIATASPGLARYALGTALVASPAYRRGGYPAFFHGRITTTGAIGYFPACVAFKFGSVALLAGLAGLALMAHRLPLTAILPPLLFFAAAVPAHYLLGARYLLPVYPFLALWAAPLGRLVPKPLVAAAALSIASAAWAYPYWIADSSAIGRAIGPIDEWFADSNLDWGQDLGRLDRRAQGRGIVLGIIGGSEFAGLAGLYPHLRLPDANLPLPAGTYSSTRWRPFLESAAKRVSAYPPALQPLVLKLRADIAVLARGPLLPEFSTPSMFGSAALAGPTR